MRERHKRNSRFQHNSRVEIAAFGEIFVLRLRKTSSVLHPSATVQFSSEDEVGNIVTGEHQYHVQSIPSHDRQKRSSAIFSGYDIIVARKPLEGIPLHDEDAEIEQHIRMRRQAAGEKPREITIEVAVYLDEDFTSTLKSRGITSPQQKLDFVILKWNWVRYNWNRPELGYNVDIQIKLVHFYETNPLFERNSAILIGQQLPASWRFSMKHTDKTPCLANRSEVGGIMGGPNPGWSPCSVASAHEFIQSDGGQCLYEVNVPVLEPGQEVTVLGGLLPGMYETKDESCEGQVGAGFRFWVFPHLASLDSCTYHVCLNTNIGPRYGEMVIRRNNIQGMYCGPGKACLRSAGGCLTYEELHLAADRVPIQQGGWSEFEPFVPASRSCGTGAKVSRRKCDNPKPLNSPDCEGEEYRAELANTQDCPGDVNDVAILRKLRAGEVCRKLLRNGVLDSSMFAPTGSSYRDIGIGQCEIKCDRIDGGSNGLYTKWGLYDDGVPCDLNIERSDWPRAAGLKGHCVRGHCKAFGCDGKLPGKTFDRCGVCGGDGFSCDAVSGVDVRSDPGKRITVIDLPAGSYDIEIAMKRQKARAPRMYLELWTKDGVAILAQRSGSSGVADTLTSEVSFGGTAWRYDSREYLLAKGPIDQPLIVKVYQTTGAVNNGIEFDFSMPLSNRHCNGTCQNGGTWWNCGCQCPPGFGGSDCSLTSRKVCFNGEFMDPVTDTCQCNNEREFGDNCRCRLPFKGDKCQTCKISACHNCGTLNTSTCRCECPIGYGGLQCESLCKDKLANCATKKANGKCESDAANMELNCAKSCGYCRKIKGVLKKVLSKYGFLEISLLCA
ncbi:A disintegrin and metalloproteinase with thrombospondin motifs 1-like [Liolophura sinensis]|uniref:A disintegrin and metalloproteinase with thrombospondin motifs 1-like n=1 Tax=Liolophura sinensis TaxID=3198878 RepID=UPI0031582C7E